MWIHHKKPIVIIMAFLLFGLIVCTLLLFNQSGETPKDEPSPETSTYKVLDFEPYQDNRIVIPGFEGIHFEPYTVNQSINFYNPKENNCYFVISLYLSDDTKIFESDYLSPGEEVNEITLLEPLEKGIYKNCTLKYRCFKLANKTELNGSTQNITISTK